MTLQRVNLDALMEKFMHLEENITKVNGKNNMLEIELEDAKRVLKFHQTKGTRLTEERDSLLFSVDQLQQAMQEQCNLRVQNERLTADVGDLKQQNERTAKDGMAKVQQLLDEMRAAAERHQRELETVRIQCSREEQDAQKQAFDQLEAKDAEVKKLLQDKDLELEEMKRRLRDQEREKQSELLKLQMEFGARLARVQSTAQWTQQQQQQQQHSSSLIPQSVFKRKLQFFQEEKNKEIATLRQRIKELEENQSACSTDDRRLKRRKI